MKRRSFLQIIGAGITSLFVPAVAKSAEKYQFTQVLSPTIVTELELVEAGYSGDLTEASLEDAVIEINEFRSKTGKLIAFEPRHVVCYPEDRENAVKLMIGI